MSLMTLVHNLKKRWRSLSKWQKALANVLLSAFVFVAYIIWQYNRMPGATLYVHNHTDRPIFSYFVNDNWGGNAAINGGGSTCCWRIESDMLKIEWIKSMTRTQYEQGAREETLSLEVSNPPRKRTDDTLHVHFLPGDRVRLAWSDKYTSPLKEELSEFYAKDQEAKTQ
jgi:hypothetical protein